MRLAGEILANCQNPLNIIQVVHFLHIQIHASLLTTAPESSPSTSHSPFSYLISHALAITALCCLAIHRYGIHVQPVYLSCSRPAPKAEAAGSQTCPIYIYNANWRQYP